MDKQASTLRILCKMLVYGNGLVLCHTDITASRFLKKLFIFF
jgi:hypothetical protein